MKIAILVRNYKPYNSAIGVCMSNIIEVLKHRNDVIVICEKTHMHEKDEEIIDGEKIIRFVSTETKRRMEIENKKHNSVGIKKIVSHIEVLLNRIVCYISFIIKDKSIREDLVDAYISSLKNVDEEVDLIIPTCMPIESVIAAKEYCSKNKISYVPILFDKFAANKTLQRFRINEIIKWNANILLESELLNSDKCRRFLYTKSWEKHMASYHSKVAEEKGYLIEHPLLKQVSINEISQFDNKKDINVVFAGTLTYKGRNPEYALNIFEYVIKKKKNLGLYIYGSGDAMEMVRTYSCKYPNNIYYMGQVRTDVAHTAMHSADCLLSFGNEDISQTASKIFEYMSYCKPIIHIARHSDDPVIRILQSYPASFTAYINQFTTNELANRVKDFLETSKNFEVSFEKLKAEFAEACPEFSAELILQ